MEMEEGVFADAKAVTMVHDGSKEDEDGEDQASSLKEDAEGGGAILVVEEMYELMEETREEAGGRGSRESRKKRKEREENGRDAGDGEVKEDRKKRRDEKEKRKAVRDGETEKREHREGRDRKDSKRKKDRRDRREERDRKDKKVPAKELDGREQLNVGGREGRLEIKEKSEGDGYAKENRDPDSVVAREPRVSKSRPATKDDDYSARNSVGTESRQHSFTLESNPEPVPLDDDKEEGEILEEETGPVKALESEVESGEIQTKDEAATTTGGDMDEVTAPLHDSLERVEKGQWDSPAATANLTSEQSMLVCDGKGSSKDLEEKAGKPEDIAPNPLQSMLVIAEAYDSESQVSDEKLGSSAVKLENRHQYHKKSENGSKKPDSSEFNRKPGIEKGKGQGKKQVMGPPEQRHAERKDRKVGSGEASRSRYDDNTERVSHGNETRTGSNPGKEELKEHVEKTRSRQISYSMSPEGEDTGRIGGKRGNDGRRRRSPSPKETKHHSRGRSPSKETRKDRQAGRARSRSVESSKRQEFSRRHSRSPEMARESSFKRRSHSREQDRRIVENLDRKKRSRSRESAHEPKVSRDNTELLDRRRRSKSRETGRSKASVRADSVDRRRRSRSKETAKDRRADNQDLTRRADSVERRRRSRSRSARDRRTEDRVISRNVDSLERRRRSRSRDSYRKQDDRDNGRHGWHGDDSRHKSSRDDRTSRDGRHYEGSRDNSHRMERDKDRSYNSSYDRNCFNPELQIKDSKQSAGDALATENIREEENQEEYQERVASQLAAQEEDDVERVKEESRRRRQAILEKYKKQQEKATDEHPSVSVKGPKANGFQADDVDEKQNQTPAGISEQLTPGVQSPDMALSLGKLPAQNGVCTLSTNAEDGGLGGGSPKSERSADMFCDDIFGESPAGGRRLGKGDGLAMDTSGLIDNWDDAEGYYCFRIGEILDGRYEVASSHGRGVFSTVVRARDMRAGRGEPEEVAIKIIRNNETMYKAGQQELVILKKLAGADPENKRHCVRLLSSFEYRSHLCLVFESLHMNLREILKKFGRNIGINLHAVRAYAKQLFISLKHLRNCGVLHCDIKPDNMLVNEQKNVLKVCDFGSAMFAGENEITPYLVSRFYRAPEIILGLPYDHALDIWSVGCCLYELYTGKMLFPGHTNNDMLRLHMELKGPFPKKMLKKAAFADQHFDPDFNFCAIEEDPVTKKAIKRILVNVKPRDMGILVTGAGTIDEDSRMLASFKDLLEKIFILDPDKRLTVSQALNHSFISGK